MKQSTPPHNLLPFSLDTNSIYDRRIPLKNAYLLVFRAIKNVIYIIFEDKAFLLNYKKAMLIYCLLFFSLMTPFVLGDVVAPYRQHNDIRAFDKGSILKENPKFSDCNHFYIPEISQNLTGKRSGWLSLWTNANEMGRPIYKISGFSPAYFPSWLLSKLTNNPWQFYTIICLFNCFFAGVFIILFCREANLNPIASLIAGTSLATSPYLMYWLTFPMYSAAFCWSSGMLWGIARVNKKPDLLGWSILAFSAYSLLITAYPQAIVYHAYIFAGYGLYIAYKKQILGWHESAMFFIFSASAVIVGAILTLPFYMDLYRTLAESDRVNCNFSFFTEVLPKVRSISEAIRFFVLTTFPQACGNPIKPDFPFPFEGFSLTPLMLFFLLVGLFSTFKKTWGWWLVTFIFFVLTFFQPAYEIAFKYFGFSFSRCIPINMTILPLTILVAYGVDVLTKRSTHKDLSRIIMIASTGLLAITIVGICASLRYGIAIHWYIVLFLLIVLMCFLAQYKKTHPLLLIIALVMTIATVSYPLILRQKLSQIATASPLVEKMQNNLPKNSRFAINAPYFAVLNSNLNATFGLDSIHSYNSLSPKRYHRLINALGGEMIAYGRHNYIISPDYNSEIFWMSNIGLILSLHEISNKNLEYLGGESGILLYKVISRMGDNLQIIPLQSPNVDSKDVEITDIRSLKKYPSSKEVDKGDLLEFKVTPEMPSLLILSQKFHRDWEAQVLEQSGWAPTKTIIVNDAFQGVVLPRDVTRVRLEFKPFIRYAWIGHVFWIFMIMFLGFKYFQQKTQPFINRAAK